MWFEKSDKVQRDRMGGRYLACTWYLDLNWLILAAHIVTFEHPLLSHYTYNICDQRNRKMPSFSLSLYRNSQLLTLLAIL